MTVKVKETRIMNRFCKTKQKEAAVSHFPKFGNSKVLTTTSHICSHSRVLH